MWVKPLQIQISGFWSTDRANPYFILQRRRGHDERRSGLATLLVATIDTVLDNKISRYRILYKRPDAEIYFLIAETDKKEDVEEHWKWIEVNMMPTLEGIDVADDISDFVQWKIKSLCTEAAYEDIGDIETEKFKNATKKFHKVFNMSMDEKLVIYYSCSFWRGRVPRQGYLYLSVNYLCFYSGLLGKEITIVIKFTDIISLERVHNIVSETIRICTRLHKYHFGMFRKLEETFQIMEQIANFAAKKLLSQKGAFQEEDHFPAVTNDYCKEYIPELYDKLEQLGIAACISLSWFLTLFVCVMPFESVLYVIDIFFYDGIKVLFQLALTILNENRHRLLACQDDGDAIMILTTYLDQFNDDNEKHEEKQIIYLIKKSYTNYNGINEEDINRLRLKHRLKVVQSMRESLLQSAAKNTLRFTKFNEREIKNIFYIFNDVSRISLTEANDPRKLAYETYRIHRDEYLILCKYLSPWYIGEQPESLANKLFDLFNLNVQPDQIDFIHFIRLWSILWNEDFKHKLIILFLSHLEDENKRKEAFNILFESTSAHRSSSVNSENISLESSISTNEQMPSLYIENGEITYLKPSQLPLMNQTEFIRLCKSIYNLMTGAANEENLFRALATSSTLLLKMGEICKSSPRQVETNDTTTNEMENEWIINFEQFEATMNAETCLVTWFENNNGNNLSLEKRIHNYLQDIQR
ncbi:unnamed protein product [Rotaria sordida]|uniref:GRAM domain-containing protein n=1 Tax=Rotaria sordida TaxID=392033 RepID=A0A814B4W5_9BILA|nr:unnamed protein product [Rotaria sordida]